MDRLAFEILYAVGLAVIILPLAIWRWRAAPKEGREELAKTLAIGREEFSPPVHTWLEHQFVRRQRWDAVDTVVFFWTAFYLSTWRPTSPRFMATIAVIIVVITTTSVAHAFRATRDLRRSRTTTRVATLRPRSIRSYLHPLELTAFVLAPLAGLGAVVVAGMARSDAPDDLTRTVVVLGALLGAMSIGIYVAQRQLVRLPLRARDEEEQIAHDLLVGLTLRELVVGVAWPAVALPLVAWNTLTEPGATISGTVVLAGLGVLALIGLILAMPLLSRQREPLWRFRELDRVPR